MLRRLLLLCLLLVLATGCAPTVSPGAQPLPTLFPTSTPEQLSLTNAERVAVTFLDAWQRMDFAAMHRLISFESQEATPLPIFQARYETAHNTMTLESLAYTPVAMVRDEVNARLVLFSYNVTFATRLLGEFTDSGRTLRLVFDARTLEWRVAWSAGDIFAQMENGGQLRRQMYSVNRGNIYDRNGRILADQQSPMVTVNIVEREISDLPACMSLLSQALNTPQETLQTRMDTFAADWVNDIGVLEPQAYLDWHVQLEETCNATFAKLPARQYHNGTLMPHILGNVGYPTAEQIPVFESLGFNQESILGQSGIERQWDATLRGIPGGTLIIETPGGAQQRVITTRQSQPAESVWLTIDADLQQFIVNAFGRAYATNAEGWGSISNGAAAVVMDMNTGGVLAMVSWPTYDANAFTPFPAIGRASAADIVDKVQTDPRNPLLNRATQGVYPNGSTMKIATGLAVGDSGAMPTNERFNCYGSWTREGITKTDWLPSGHGILTLRGAVEQSCNPYFYEAGYQMNLLDPLLLPNYMQRFGFGVPTGLIDIPESPGYVSTPELKRLRYGEPWSFVDASLLAIGQEAEVTPLQVVRLTAAVGNGGILYRPYVVERTGLFDDFSYTAEPDPMSNIDIDPEVVAIVQEGMCDVTTTNPGTATYQFRDYPDIQSIGVCGKTGTAQNLVRGTTHAWFVAYAPRENPEIAIVVMVEDAGEGSGVAAPITRDILRYYFFGVEPPPPPSPVVTSP